MFSSVKFVFRKLEFWAFWFQNDSDKMTYYDLVFNFDFKSFWKFWFFRSDNFGQGLLSWKNWFWNRTKPIGWLPINFHPLKFLILRIHPSDDFFIFDFFQINLILEKVQNTEIFRKSVYHVIIYGSKQHFDVRMTGQGRPRTIIFRTDVTYTVL